MAPLTINFAVWGKLNMLSGQGRHTYVVRHDAGRGGGGGGYRVKVRPEPEPRSGFTRWTASEQAQGRSSGITSDGVTHLNAAVEDASAALLIHVGCAIARQRSSDAYLAERHGLKLGLGSGLELGLGWG